MLLDRPPAVERRITLRLLAYWEKLRSGRDMPAESDLKPEDIADLWDQCFLLHAEHFGNSNYHYSYMGDSITKAWLDGAREGDASELVSPHTARLAPIYRDIIKTGKPIINEGEFRNQQGQAVRLRQCLVPLGKDGRVEAILGSMRFKVFRLP